MTSYESFIASRSQPPKVDGFSPLALPGFLYDFQQSLVEWALNRGKAAIFADCGLGKTPMQLVWADQVRQHTNRSVLILTPLAVGRQTIAEGDKFGIGAVRSRDGSHPSAASLVVTNYEKLHLFDPTRFSGVVCDESSILKHFGGATQRAVTQFMRGCPYRLLCTATAAPNDYVELGTSSEALGELGQVDMLSRFFKQDPKIHTLTERARREKALARGESSHHKMIVSGTGASWRLKGHAVTPFWRWVAGWARACRNPSDLGFLDDRFVLPELIEQEHIFQPTTIEPGMLFSRPAVGFREERAERRRTIRERCEVAARLVDDGQPAVVWCHLNAEGDLLAQLIPDSVQVAGATSDEAKEDAYRAFEAGEIRVLVIKPKIGAWGLNWQHCAHVVTFASHSYEQYYQSVRRCWRFGQQRPVVVDIVATEGERRVRENMARKSQAADAMFSELVTHMNAASHLAEWAHTRETMEAPAWMQ